MRALRDIFFLATQDTRFIAALLFVVCVASFVAFFCGGSAHDVLVIIVVGWIGVVLDFRAKKRTPRK